MTASHESSIKLTLSLDCTQSALFNFQSLLLVILLAICTATYVRATFPGVVDRNKEGYVCLVRCT